MDKQVQIYVYNSWDFGLLTNLQTLMGSLNVPSVHNMIPYDIISYTLGYLSSYVRLISLTFFNIPFNTHLGPFISLLCPRTKWGLQHLDMFKHV